MAAEMMAGETIANTTMSDLEAMAQRAERDALSNNNKRKFVPENSDQGYSANKHTSVLGGGEIDIDDVTEADTDTETVVEKAVPAAVFGSITTAVVR